VRRDSEPFKQTTLAAALKEAVIAAVVACGLFALMVGIKTDQGPTGGLVFTTRFGVVGVLVAIAFAMLGRSRLAPRPTQQPLF